MKTLTTLLLCVILFSCTKEPNTASGTNATGSVQYKVNGQEVVINNVDLASGQYAVFSKQLKGIIPATRYILNAQVGSNNSLAFSIVTDSLLATNFHYDSLNNPLSSGFISTLLFNGQAGTVIFKGDALDITITSYKDSKISGSFNGRLTSFDITNGANYNNRGTLVITEGVIKDVQVVY